MCCLSGAVGRLNLSAGRWMYHLTPIFVVRAHSRYCRIVPESGREFEVERGARSSSLGIDRRGQGSGVLSVPHNDGLEVPGSVSHSSDRFEKPQDISNVFIVS